MEEGGFGRIRLTFPFSALSALVQDKVNTHRRRRRHTAEGKKWKRVVGRITPNLHLENGPPALGKREREFPKREKSSKAARAHTHTVLLQVAFSRNPDWHRPTHAVSVVRQTTIHSRRTRPKSQPQQQSFGPYGDGATHYCNSNFILVPASEWPWGGGKVFVRREIHRLGFLFFSSNGPGTANADVRPSQPRGRRTWSCSPETG